MADPFLVGFIYPGSASAAWPSPGTTARSTEARPVSIMMAAGRQSGSMIRRIVTA